MKYNGKELKEFTDDELKAVDADLLMKETTFNKSLLNASDRIKKLNPQPTLGPHFIKLQKEIKNEIERRQNVT